MHVNPADRGLSKSLLLCAIGASLASACCPKSTGGKVGAVAGAAVGGPVGEIGGALVGDAIDEMLDEDDRPISKDTRPIAYALETNQQVQWSNPKTGYSYQVDPMGSYNRDGKQCREFRMVTRAPGQPQPQVAFGTSCRTSDGSWGQPDQG
jgi:surface antigen